jgi:tetratricopeptide (TPR) repeat protein
LGQEGNDPTLRLEAGLAWRRVGSIYAYMGGQDAAAKHAHGESVALLEGLVAEDSRNPEYRLALAESQVQLANVMIYHMDDSDAGEARLRQARALQEELAAEHAGETAHYEALNQIEQGLAEVLHRRGKNADAEKAYGRAAVWIEKATDGSPTTLQADFLFNLAGLLISTLRKKEAEDALRQSLVVRAKVLAKSAGAWDRAANTWTLGRLAQLLADTGRPGEAEDAYCRAIKEGIDLVRDFPHVINNLSSLGGHYLLLAQLREAADQTGDAERLYRQAWTVVMDGVEPAHPPPGFWFARLHETEVCLVRLLVTADRRPEAATYLEQAELYWDRLAARSKAAVEYRRELAWTCRSLAEVLAADHRPGKAKQARQKRVSVLEEMVRLLTEKLGPAHPDTVATQIQLIEACESVGQMPDAEAAEVLGVTGPPPRLVPDRP